MEQTLVFCTLALALVLFIWGKIRHDFTALIVLFFLVAVGIVPASDAFNGFGHPAVITVAAVLVIGKALEHSGLIDVAAKYILRIGGNPTLQILCLCAVVAIASGFMNNVGALAIMMPIAIYVARKSDLPPSYVLMPIAFSSLLGGLTTLIGTPPNIIIAEFRAENLGSSFGMFEFTPVGASLAFVGVLFVGLLGWRFLPARQSKSEESDLFDIDDYITELRVPEEADVIGSTLYDIIENTEEDVQILGLVRNNQRIHTFNILEKLQAGDILILQCDTDALQSIIEKSGLSLVGGKQFRMDAEGSRNIILTEAVVMSGSPLVGKTASSSQLRTRYGVNLLAVARRETKILRRLGSISFKNGDVILLQGRAELIDETLANLGCLPLARRQLRFGFKKKVSLALGIFGLSIAAVVMGFLPVQVAFSMAAVALVLSGVLPLKEVYTSIDWPVIVLLGAMIPVGQSLETTGAANTIANQILLLGEHLPVWGIIATLLIMTMLLSDIINNAATVLIMAPIGMSIGQNLGLSLDPFLMTVAVGGSCAFLTPIGHQSNTIVMGPGGYKFSDYWRMGLPMDIIIVTLGTPLIMYFWPPS
ncbi:MAG: SLC13 family permease [Bacteroidetes bacterium]|jgi:di/tricarboxylate transporter|nr:SLC13 family permease [Bacteroidota bacterium]